MKVRMVALAVFCCFLGLLAWNAATSGKVPDQQYRLMVRTDLIPVQFPLHQPFSVLRRTPGGNGSLYVEVEWKIQSAFRSVVWKVEADGSVRATYDLSTAGVDVGRDVKFAVDSSGNVYFLTLPSPKPDKATTVSPQGALLPVIYLFGQDGAFDKTVTLSKELEPRQLAVTSSGTLVVAGSAVETGTEETARRRQVLYEFKSNGNFIRELKLVSKEKTKEESAPTDPEKFAIMTDLSHLLVDSAGSLYIIQPSEEPRILRFGADCELAAEHRLAKLPGTMVTQAILDGQGRVVLERITVRKPREPRPENRTRVLTVLNGETLDTILEALPPADTGGLAGVKGSDFLFLGRHGPLTLEIATATVQ